MANILTCTDGSLYAPSVYAHAAWAAQKIDGATIHVLHMLNPHHEEPVKADYSGSIGFNARAHLLDELVKLEAAQAKLAQKRGQAILEDAVAKLEAAHAGKVHAEQKHGKLSEEITRYERDASLVVLGKRGNNADFEKGHLGSNLERVIRSCEQPVLVAARAYQPIQQFVLAFDGGPSARKAVDYAIQQPLLKGLQCTLLYVGSGNAAIESALASAQADLSKAGFSVAIEQRDGDPAQVIGEVVEQDPIDLLVMGAYGHSHIRHLIVGSTTTEMIRTVRIPVLLFR
jgi:nucleotide-binding universal stress UspA family protein